MGSADCPVHSKHVVRARLLARRDIASRLDVSLFAAVYVAAAAAAAASRCVRLHLCFAMDAERWCCHRPTLRSVAVAGSLLLLTHAVLLLCAHWSVRLRAALRHRSVSDAESAHTVLVQPSQFSGPPLLLPLQQRGAERFFEFRKQAFTYDCAQRCFRRRTSPRLTFAAYANSRGLASPQDVHTARELHGPNSFAIPLPRFRHLLTCAMLEPFFVFQVLCCILWSLDDMWLTSMFTLLMLVVFEATVVTTRLRTAKELREQGAPRQSVHAHRCGAWLLLTADELLPGDIVSLGRPKGVHSERFVVPADVLLLSGSCIATEALLTGETAPQWKAAAPGTEEQLALKCHRAHIVFGGTKIVQHSEGKLPGLRPPDGGCLAIVLRTGFCSEQGKLMRTILFSTDSVSAHSREAGVFIAILLCFAVAAAALVLHQGLQDERRSRWKLFLHATLVLTSVIPPELPMELTIAVNASLVALSKLHIFCTEPFRIPMAGKLDVCAFDKTGTLTHDDLRFEGISLGADPCAAAQRDADAMPLPAAMCLGACHALVMVDNTLAGDPLELAALKGVGWIYGGGDVVQTLRARDGMRCVRIMRRLHFSPQLRRMAAVVQEDRAEGEHAWVVVKGAPEAVLPLCSADSLPAGADDTYRRCAARGMRVLALAARPLATADRGAPRDQLESGLRFVAFALFACPTREDSAAAISALRRARLPSIMLTGDGPLTACHVARETGIVTRPLLLLTPSASNPDCFEWTDEEGGSLEAFDAQKIAALGLRHDLCVSASSLQHANQTGALDALVRHTQVYARCDPAQKADVVKALRAAGLSALMCGDGTNDTGALKAAAVGVALVAVVQGSSGKRLKRSTMDEVPVVRLGDASLAAPFTAKMPSITSCLHVVRQGRAALVTTIQMYKCLGVQCLVSAFALSVQYLEGVKWSDTQATVAGLVTAAMFMMLALAKPAVHLSPQRPHASVFSAYAMLSIGVQFAAHLALLWRAVDVAKAHAPDELASRMPDDDFAPALVNTAAFLASSASQLSTFSVNYVGAPFNAPLTENRPLLWTLLLCAALLVVLTLNAAPDMAVALELRPVPLQLQRLLLLGGVGDLALSWAVEHGLRYALPERVAAAALALAPGM